MNSQPCHPQRRGAGPSHQYSTILSAILALLLLSTACPREPGPRGKGRSTTTQAMGMGGWPPPDPTPEPEPSAAVDHLLGFRTPTRLALARDGVLYVSDTGRGAVARVSLEGRRLGTLSGFVRPLGIALFEPPQGDSVRVCRICVPPRRGERCHPVGQGLVKQFAAGRPARNKWCQTVSNPGGRVYVGDQADGAVRILAAGAVVGHLGAGAGEFLQPNAIAVTSDGIVYVADSKARAVKVYDYQGESLGSFGTMGDGGQLGFPTDLVLNEQAGELYVSDFAARRIVAFDLEGRWVRDIAAPPNDSGDPAFFRPAGLGSDADGNLYVVDNALASVAMLDPDGNLLATIGYRNGKYWTGELSVPVDAVATGGRVYVTSSRAGRVSVFEVTP